MKTKVITQKDINAGIKKLENKKSMFGCSDVINEEKIPPCDAVPFSAKARIKELYTVLPYLKILFETGDAINIFNKVIYEEWFGEIEEVPLSEAEVLMCRTMFEADKLNVHSSYQSLKSKKEMIDIEGMRPYFKFDITLVLK